MELFVIWDFQMGMVLFVTFTIGLIFVTKTTNTDKYFDQFFMVLLATLTTGLVFARQSKQGVANLCPWDNQYVILVKTLGCHPLLWSFHKKMSPVMNVASKTFKNWLRYLGVCGVVPFPPVQPLPLPHPKAIPPTLGNAVSVWESNAFVDTMLCWHFSTLHWCCLLEVEKFGTRTGNSPS